MGIRVGLVLCADFREIVGKATEKSPDISTTLATDIKAWLDSLEIGD